MDPMILLTFMIVIVLVTGGVMTIELIKGFNERARLKLEKEQTDPRLDDVVEDYRQLEARLERMEEEVEFFRELKGGEKPPSLPPSGEDAE